MRKNSKSWMSKIIKISEIFRLFDLFRKFNLYTYIYIFSFLISFLLLQSNTKIYAQEQFTINYDLSYEINESGEANINQKTTITNLQNDVIPTSYSFSAKQMKIFDTNATVNGKNTTVRKQEKDDETEVIVNLINYAIGEGRQNKIDLNFKSSDIAIKTGDIWNIYIPKINIPSSTVIYNVKLIVPKSIGPKLYISPTPIIEKEFENYFEYYFTKENFIDKGISAAFGNYQNINFVLKYQIENNSFISGIYQVAFPPDISYMQQVKYTSVDPAPLKMFLDADGNVIAYYRLKPKSKMEVILSGSAKISGRQINPDHGRNMDSIPKVLVTNYTKEQRFWETNSTEIKNLSNTLKDNNLNVIKNSQKVYDYITQNLSYNFEALNQEYVQRQGALTALTKKGPWTCMEYTDLFVAILRSMKIPAREINGYAFTNSQNDKPISISLKGGDLLHSWAEFYDPYYGWIQVDPTWGSTSGIDYFTKLDTSHFAFVRKGISSEKPYPAGAYRFDDSQRLVEVEFSQTNENNNYEASISVKKVINLNPIQLIKGNSLYKVTNTSGVFVYNLSGHSIPPGQTIKIYIPKYTTQLEYFDYNNNKKIVDIK